MNVNRPLKTVTSRVQSCRTVVWALDTFGDRLVAELDEPFLPLLGEGQVMPFETQLELFKKMLILGRDRMVATDRAYRDQRAREVSFRARRDEAVRAVNRDVVDLHSALMGFYSPERLAEIGFARRTPQLPEELSEQASHLAVRLSDPDLDLSGARFELQVEGANLVLTLSGSAAKLKQAIDDLTREERKTEALKLAKDEALEQYNQWFLWIARTVESLLRLAGLDEVARRVRPSHRRAGETVSQPQPSEEASSETSPAEGETSSASQSEAASPQVEPSAAASSEAPATGS